MLYSYEELIGKDSDIDITTDWLNSELDYVLCGHFGVCLDTIDFVWEIGADDLIRELRIYALFENQELIDNYKNQFKAIEKILSKCIDPKTNEYYPELNFYQWSEPTFYNQKKGVIEYGSN